MNRFKQDWPIYVLVIVLGVGGVLLALYSPRANAIDFGVGVGIGLCAGGDHSDPYNYCDAGSVVKVFARASHRISEHSEIEGEIYHFSHPESEDLHRSEWNERTWDQDGVTINYIYWF